MRDYTIARYGDWGTVATLVAQRLLNMNMGPSEHFLVEDAKFGPKTLHAVRRFQQQHPPLVVDGIVGPKTFEALELKTLESYRVRPHAQRQGGRCWAAAAAMLLGGLEPSAGNAQTNHRGALIDTDANVEAFGKGLNWDFFSAAAPIQRLLAALDRGPLWMGGDSVNARGTADAIHALVLAGMFLYEFSGKKKVLLRIYDPWPPGQGRIYFMQFEDPRLPGCNFFKVRWFLSPRVWLP
jgi:hypothetical protein